MDDELRLKAIRARPKWEGKYPWLTTVSSDHYVYEFSNVYARPFRSLQKWAWWIGCSVLVATLIDYAAALWLPGNRALDLFPFVVLALGIGMAVESFSSFEENNFANRLAKHMNSTSEVETPKPNSASAAPQIAPKTHPSNPFDVPPQND